MLEPKLDHLPYEFCDMDELPLAVKATNTTRGKARQAITSQREVPFISGSLTIQWFALDDGQIIHTAPYAKGALPYWYYDGP